MAPLLDPPLTVAHRFVDSEASLVHYTRRPGGVMWQRRELFEAPVFYLAFHGRTAGFASTLGRIGAQALCEAFEGYGGYRNLVYFAACNVLRGERGLRFARQFIRASGTR